jgi:hypothetical protein
MDGYLKRQLTNARRGTPLQARRTEGALYAGCLPQASGTGAHPLTTVRHLASQGPCWDGYHRDYSKKEGANDSCVKDGKKKKKGKKEKKAKKAKKGEGDASSSSSSSDDEDGKPKKKKAKKEEK